MRRTKEPLSGEYLESLRARYDRLDSGLSKSERAYLLLRQEILFLRLQPGQQINEKLLNEALDISRTPVREAIMRLSEENLIDINPSSATYISEINRVLIDEAMKIREPLELMGIRRAASQIDEKTLFQLHGVVSEMDLMLERDQLDEYLLVDDRFHMTIAMASGYPTLWKIINIPKAQLDRLRQISAPLPGHLKTVTEQHKEILEALETRDPELCVKRLRDHLRYASDVMRKLIPDETR